MNKEKIMNDMKFRKVCNKFGLDWSDFEIMDKLIVLKTPVDNLYFFLDSNYNIVEIEKCFSELNNHICSEIYYGYENFNDIVPFGDDMGYPFNEITLKQINDIANRINDKRYGSKIEINGELYEIDKDNPYIQLINYIKFLNKEIDIYWKNIYSLKLLGFEVPDIYAYLRNIIYKINQCIDTNLKNNQRPHSFDIMNEIGQNMIYTQNEEEYSDLLYSVIKLLMKDKNMKAVPGTICEIQPINEKEKIPSLPTLVSNLIKILEVSDEQVIANRQNYSDNKCKQKIKSIEPWLSEDIDD